ncbi:hypothetical protein IAT40_003093 [Kwoniella sp. CBS 6097]
MSGSEVSSAAHSSVAPKSDTEVTETNENDGDSTLDPDSSDSTKAEITATTASAGTDRQDAQQHDTAACTESENTHQGIENTSKDEKMTDEDDDERGVPHDWSMNTTGSSRPEAAGSNLDSPLLPGEDDNERRNHSAGNVWSNQDTSSEAQAATMTGTTTARSTSTFRSKLSSIWSFIDPWNKRRNRQDRSTGIQSTSDTGHAAIKKFSREEGAGSSDSGAGSGKKSHWWKSRYVGTSQASTSAESTNDNVVLPTSSIATDLETGGKSRESHAKHVEDNEAGKDVPDSKQGDEEILKKKLDQVLKEKEPKLSTDSGSGTSEDGDRGRTKVRRGRGKR